MIGDKIAAGAGRCCGFLVGFCIGLWETLGTRAFALQVAVIAALLILREALR